MCGIIGNLQILSREVTSSIVSSSSPKVGEARLGLFCRGAIEALWAVSVTLTLPTQNLHGPEARKLVE